MKLCLSDNINAKNIDNESEIHLRKADPDYKTLKDDLELLNLCCIVHYAIHIIEEVNPVMLL